MNGRVCMSKLQQTAAPPSPPSPPSLLPPGALRPRTRGRTPPPSGGVFPLPVLPGPSSWSFRATQRLRSVNNGPATTALPLQRRTGPTKMPPEIPNCCRQSLVCASNRSRLGGYFAQEPLRAPPRGLSCRSGAGRVGQAYLTATLSYPSQPGGSDKKPARSPLSPDAALPATAL